MGKVRGKGGEKEGKRRGKGGEKELVKREEEEKRGKERPGRMGKKE